MRPNADHPAGKGFIILLVCCCTLAARGYEFAGGTGEPNDPYRIATAEQLVSIGSDPNLLDKHFVLLNDIDLDPNLFGGRVFAAAVIAPDILDYSLLDAFTGSFNGGGHSIRNLRICSGSADQLALFGYIGERAVVRDLRVDDADVEGPSSSSCSALAAQNQGRLVHCHVEAHVSGSTGVGTLVGRNYGEIVDCSSVGEVVGNADVGGVAGCSQGGVILRSRSTSNVSVGSAKSGSKWFGGLVGHNYGPLIQDCYAAGSVVAEADASYVGGLVGANETGSTIVNSYATGDVFVGARGSRVGGLVGGMSDGASVHDCYATGDVSGGDSASYLGGLIGEGVWGYAVNSYSTGRVCGGVDSTWVGGLIGGPATFVSGCFWDTETSGVSTSKGGTGLTTAQTQDMATFAEAKWDWVDERANGTADLWFIPAEGGYPQLTVHGMPLALHKLEGSGTSDDPYRIATAEDLGAINHYDLAACYRLEADANLAGIAWSRAPVGYFEGQFDGAGKVVTALHIRGNIFLGLFGQLNRRASVTNLGVRDANITGVEFLGSIAGWNEGNISSCYATGSVAGGGGGLTGWNVGTISDSYALGSVTSDISSLIGGLAARNAGTINRCYAAAHVTGPTPLPLVPTSPGGLVGSHNRLFNGEIHDSYFLIDTDGGGPDNGLGIVLTDTQMKQQASFAAWDFDKVWTICEGKSYPRLRWEDVDCGR